MDQEVLRQLVEKLERSRSLRRQLQKISPAQARVYTQDLLYHIDIHLAAHTFEPIESLWRLALRLAEKGQDRELQFKVVRKRAQWLEAQHRPGPQARYLHHLYSQLLHASDPQEGDRFKLGDLLMELGAAYAQTGRYSLALSAIDRARKIFRRLRDEYNTVAADFNRASLLYEVGQYAESTMLCAEILPQAEKHSDIFANVLLQLANNLEAMRLPNRACQFYGKAMSAYYKLHNYRQQSDISYRLGWLMLKKEHFELAARCLRAAFFIKVEIEYKRALMRRNYLKGQTYYGLGLWGVARRYYLLTLIFAEQLGDSAMVTLARHGFYKTRGDLQLTLAGAMSATSLDGERVWNFYRVPGGFQRYKTDGYALPPYPERLGYRPNPKEQRNLRNLLRDLTFCSGAKNSIEAAYFRSQQQAFSDL